MSKKYRYITTTPRELCQWANTSQLIVEIKGKSVATRDSMARVMSLVNLGLPFPPLVLAEYSVDGKKKYRVVYGAGLVSAILYYIASTSEKEKATQAFKEFMRYEFTAFVVGNDNKKNDYLFEVFKGLNRKG